ncbi:MAG: NapC/NirT family cytochrome c [Methanocellales archaeon]|nr:NapC/NirT family cytochrome c [Methanocellales archaeon]
MVSKRLNIIIVFIVLLAIAGFGALTMLHYTESPEFCAECHIMEPYYRSYLSSDYLDHKHEQVGITCDGCHIEPGTTTIEIGIHSIFAEVIPYYTGAYEDPVPPGHVPREHCLQCHEDYQERTSHLEINPHGGGDNCDACHQGHQKEFADADCAKCHARPYANLREAGGKHAVLQDDRNCAFCHNVHGYIPGCADCHGRIHGEDFASCGDCHVNAHMLGDIELKPIESRFCASCHAKQSEDLGSYPSKHAKVQCTSCHPGHKKIPTCDLCHFGHGDMIGEDCADCHASGHMPKEVSYATTTPSNFCVGCHAEPYQVLMASATRHATLTCAYCHPTHGLIPTCESCHPLPHGTTFTDCATCHTTAHSTRI